MSINSRRQRLTNVQTKFFVLLISLVLLTVSCQANQAQPTPPPHFQRVAEVDLSAQSHDAETVGEFTVAETAVTNIFYTLPNADTPYFDLSLVGPEGEKQVILHSESYRTDASGGGTWEQNLPAGTYRLVLTADSGAGVLSVYWGHP
ncbi:MAG: hypothetical protein CL608_25760 [Anaerolineaceae bacterium]|nr:hypothetical protein [Anaerolineaceae bacterium]